MLSATSGLGASHSKTNVGPAPYSITSSACINSDRGIVSCAFAVPRSNTSSKGAGASGVALLDCAIGEQHDLAWHPDPELRRGAQVDGEFVARRKFDRQVRRLRPLDHLHDV